MTTANYCAETRENWLKEPTQQNFEKLVASMPTCEIPEKKASVSFVAAPDATLICIFKGKFDFAAAQRLEGCLPELLKDCCQAASFDLKEVGFVASAFLRICLQGAKLRGENKFSLRNPSPDVRKVLKIAGFDKMIAA